MALGPELLDALVHVPRISHERLLSRNKRPFPVSRYLCLLLCGLSGSVISIKSSLNRYAFLMCSSSFRPRRRCRSRRCISPTNAPSICKTSGVTCRATSWVTSGVTSVVTSEAKNVRVTPVLDLSCWPFLNLWAGLEQTSETKMLESFAGDGLLGAAARLHHVRRVQEDRAGDGYRGGARRGMGMTERVRGEEGI